MAICVQITVATCTTYLGGLQEKRSAFECSVPASIYTHTHSSSILF